MVNFQTGRTVLFFFTHLRKTSDAYYFFYNNKLNITKLHGTISACRTAGTYQVLCSATQCSDLKNDALLLTTPTPLAVTHLNVCVDV